MHAGVQATERITRSQDVQTDDPPATSNASIQVEVMTKSTSTQTQTLDRNNFESSLPDAGKLTLVFCSVCTLGFFSA